MLTVTMLSKDFVFQFGHNHYSLAVIMCVNMGCHGPYNYIYEVMTIILLHSCHPTISWWKVNCNLLTFKEDNQLVECGSRRYDIMTNCIYIRVNQCCEGRTVKEVVGGCTCRRGGETRNT
jgi:hypothetical protein